MSRSIKKVVLLIIVLWLSTFVYSQQNITFVLKGTSHYHIVIPAKSSAIEKDAAKMLQTYISKISGVTLPVTTEPVNANKPQLIVGFTSGLKNTDTSGLAEDGILIKGTGKSLILSGGSRKGVLYSVSVFLEQVLNCHFYNVDCIIVPSQKTLSFPVSINIRQVPSFSYRMSLFNNLTKDFCDFNRQNYFLEDWGLWVHSFEVLLPVEIYFKTHPEYYALVNGKRVPDQLCLSNPAVLNLVIVDLKQRIQRNPSAKYWSVSQNDNENYCQCENCRKLDTKYQSHQGSLLSFVNNVAKNFPDKTITTLAYQYSQKPPINLKPLKNVMIMLCRINEERRVPISFRKSGTFIQDMNDWLSLTKNIFMWDYVAQFSSPFNPFPNQNALQPNIQYFNEKGISYLFEQGIDNQTSEFAELKAYLIAKLMWNKNLKIDNEKMSFLIAFYGSAGANYIKQYIDLLESNADKTNASLSSFGFPYHAANYYLKPLDINDYKQIFQKALAATPLGTVYYQRINKEYLSVLFAELEINKPQFMKSKSESDTNLLNLFYKTAKATNVKFLTADKKTVQSYYEEYKKAIQ